MNTDIVIIGAGISGLHTAYKLQKRGINFILVEARERLGGRILSNNYELSTTDSDIQSELIYDVNKPAYDLGPSWFWPGQNHMQTLIDELNLNDDVFQQQAKGQSVYEDQQGNIQQGFYGISMEGAYRINGGMQQIISNLETQIDKQYIKTSAKVESVEYKNDQVITTITNINDNKTFQIISNKLVIAIPPRLVMSSIEFKPSLEESRVNELNSYATWMAGHAKILLTYKQPFWLEKGLSGDAVSHLGPLREIHDASSRPNDPENKIGYALFGFLGVPGSYRKGNKDEIINAAIDQLIRIFGDGAANPSEVVLQDWAQEEFTATDADQSMTGGHANSSIRNYTEAQFDDRLIWSGTETANHATGYNGLIEGALEASERSLTILKN